MSNPSNPQRYAARGVSASKEDVYKAIGALDKGLFPNAFCKILPDLLGGDNDYCNIVHADGSGTKSSLAYLYWKETGHLDVWAGIAQDGIVMNTDDLLCAGAIDNLLYCSIVNRNKNLIPAEVLQALINGAAEFFDKMREHGVNILYAGGETADLGDVVRTVTVDSTMTARMKKADVIEANIKPGDVILGLSSYGQATYEDAYNSGIGSNGLTAARHETLHHDYAALDETYDPALDDALVYSGKIKLTDRFEDAPVDAGRLLLSPTRTYVPLMKRVFEKHRGELNALIHCTGGGQKKVMHYAPQGVRIVKDNWLPVPPVFRMIQLQGATPWQEMYTIFNMGHRMEVYTDESTAKSIQEMAASFNIESTIVGGVEESASRQLVLDTPHGVFEY
jgi:phosphoribosylformylglycinamidine cyclo-ligase